MTTGLLQVTTSAASRQEAEQLARALVEERLAACGQVSGPISSYYWWEGRLNSAEEWYCVLKTTASRYGELETRLRQLHTYQNPEIMALPIVIASQAYADWVDLNTRSPS